MADGPTTAVLDTFTRADENPLSGGGNWVQLDSAITGTVRLATNEVQVVAAAAAYYWTPGTFGAFETYITISTYGTNGAWGVGGRLVRSATGYGGYFLMLNRSGATTQATLTLRKNLPGDTPVTGTILGAKVISGFAAGDKFMLRGVGRFLECWSSIGGVWGRDIVAEDTLYMGGSLGMYATTILGVKTINFGGGTYAGPEIGYGPSAVEPLIGI